MSEEDTGAQEPAALNIRAVTDVYNQPEINLVELAMLADFIGFAVTLYMPWGVVAGNAAAPNAYYRHLAESARAAKTDPNLPEGWDQVLEDWAERNFDPYSELSPADRMDNVFREGWNLTSHMIIRDARCLMAGAVNHIQHEFLRVRLTDVTAWAWGAAI